MKVALGFALSLFQVACNSASVGQRQATQGVTRVGSKLLDETRIDNTVLEVLDGEGSCMLKAGGDYIKLQPKAPCYFLRRAGKVQLFDYKDVGVTWIAIVAGTAVDDSTRKQWDLNAGELCGGQSQGVLYKNGGVRVTQGTHSGGVFCKEKGVDEKEFWSFAHDAK